MISFIFIIPLSCIFDKAQDIFYQKLINSSELRELQTVKQTVLFCFVLQGTQFFQRNAESLVIPTIFPLSKGTQHLE